MCDHDVDWQQSAMEALQLEPVCVVSFSTVSWCLFATVGYCVCLCALVRARRCTGDCDSSEGMCADRPYIILSGSLAADRD